MKNFVEKLKKYFETTSREQVLKDWEETKDFDEVGPTFEEFLKKTNENIKKRTFCSYTQLCVGFVRWKNCV